jgi:hypothetical protein
MHVGGKPFGIPPWSVAAFGRQRSRYCRPAIPLRNRISWGSYAANLRSKKGQSFQRSNFAAKFLNCANSGGLKKLIDAGVQIEPNS